MHDAISAGCVVVAPDFPIIRSQVMRPIEMGATYSKLDELEKAFRIAMEEILPTRGDRFEKWRNGRTAEIVWKSLATHIE